MEEPWAPTGEWSMPAAPPQVPEIPPGWFDRPLMAEPERPRRAPIPPGRHEPARVLTTAGVVMLVGGALAAVVFAGIAYVAFMVAFAMAGNGGTATAYHAALVALAVAVLVTVVGVLALTTGLIARFPDPQLRRRR